MLACSAAILAFKPAVASAGCADATGEFGFGAALGPDALGADVVGVAAVGADELGAADRDCSALVECGHLARQIVELTLHLSKRWLRIGPLVERVHA